MAARPDSLREWMRRRQNAPARPASAGAEAAHSVVEPNGHNSSFAEPHDAAPAAEPPQRPHASATLFSAKMTPAAPGRALNFGTPNGGVCFNTPMFRGLPPPPSSVTRAVVGTAVTTARVASSRPAPATDARPAGGGGVPTSLTFRPSASIQPPPPAAPRPSLGVKDQAHAALLELELRESQRAMAEAASRNGEERSSYEATVSRLQAALDESAVVISK